MNGIRTSSILLAAFFVVSVAQPVRAFDELHSGLRVSPYEGRPGATLYVSGYGLQPNTRLFIMFACPNYQVAQLGNTFIFPPTQGPLTDARGQFSAWPMKAPRLSHVTSSGCTVYAQDGVGDHYGPAQLGLYYVLGPQDRVLPCDKRICFTLTPSPKRVKSGRIENVDVQGWAGARADVTVTYPGYPPVVETVKLDWNGSGRVRVPVPKGMQDTSHVRITAHCRLGKATGDRRAEFTVVH